LEDDLASSAVIEPSEIITPIDMPANVVLCFFSEIIESIAGRGDATKVKNSSPHTAGTRSGKSSTETSAWACCTRASAPR
jgi:hypothetical protein